MMAQDGAPDEPPPAQVARRQYR